ncbi:hypothetical protein M3194_15760 [Paenibacillus glycanilyticus]|uniref:hypothetical protein n=1 Tax=Paenibacillus glycanilyticus TaxID=126569 RepID=UPI002041F4EC|nr:hypothetical protein [Paenibacillus glycanilyticus]MCM3628800.1 hypothetical protein [Paenibacillus glycanilyticus]
MANTITPQIVDEFMLRMHLDDNEDGNLQRILEASNDDLMRICGNYDIESYGVFKELVFERSRYAYNDALEYFYTNFLIQINNLALTKAFEGILLDGDANES